VVNRTRVRIWLCMAAVSVPAGISWADSIWTQRQRWENCRITWIQDGKLRFQAADRTLQVVPLAAVRRVQVETRDHLNRAEQARLAGRSAEAATAYEAALRSEVRPDLANFIRWRLMHLYGQTGQLDRAVEMYVDLVKQPDFQLLAAKWRPERLEQVRPKVREAALARLRDALRQVRPGLASDAVRRLAEYIQTARTETPSDRPPADRTGATDAGSLAGRAVKALKAGQYLQALRTADAALARKDLPRRMLADVLFVRGVALWHLADDRAKVLQAGWALARLLIELPSSEHAAACRYYLGLVHQRLGRPETARRLLQQVRADPLASEEWKQRAQRALLNIAEK